MISASIPENETERLLALMDYGIIDSLPEAEYDDITRIAAQVCGTSMSMVTIIDSNRQWFKSRYGLSISESPREQSFCAHTISTSESFLVVEDSSTDERFFDNPLVTDQPHIRFYAGVPLRNESGFAVGALCVADQQPMSLSDDQLETIQALGRQVMRLFELRKAQKLLEKKQRDLAHAYDDLDKFTTIASHDLRSPLNNIISLTTLLNELYGNAFDDDGNAFMKYLQDSAYQLSSMVASILEYSKSTTLLVDKMERIHLPDLVIEISALLSPPDHIIISVAGDRSEFVSSKIAIKQILMNLINNSIKYNDKPNGNITVALAESSEQDVLSVSDNGPGVTDEEKEKMFEVFERLKYNSSDKEGSGIGLSVVKRLITKLSGSISVESELGKGMSIKIMLPKSRI